LVIADENEDPKDLKQRQAALAALKIHPRESEANRAALARANRCWEAARADTRTWLEEQIRRFEAALATQDPRIADRARDEFQNALDSFEGSTFL
jgi:molecular chaperone HscC